MRTLIKNGTIFTQNPRREIFQRADLLIEDSRISTIGQNLQYDADEIIDATGMWVIPGLINPHVHLGESIYAPWMSSRYGLSKYLENRRACAQKLNLEDKRSVVATYSLLQLIRSGTTTIAGGRTYEPSSHLGIRNVSGYMLMQSRKLGHFAERLPDMPASSFSSDTSGLSLPAIFIHSLDTTDPSLLKSVSRLRQASPGIRIMLHISETAEAVRRIRERYGKTEIEILSSYGLLDRNTLLVHGNHLSDSDLRVVAEKGSSIAHCLSSNLNTADRTLDLASALSHGVNVTLATDGVITGSDFSVLREAGIAYRYHNRFSEGSAVSSQKFLDMITLDAASALGIQERVGSLEIGKEADIVIAEPPMGLEMGTADHLLHYANLIQMRDVMVAGQFVLKDKESPATRSREIEQEFKMLASQAEPPVT